MIWASLAPCAFVLGVSYQHYILAKNVRTTQVIAASYKYSESLQDNTRRMQAGYKTTKLSGPYRPITSGLQLNYRLRIT